MRLGQVLGKLAPLAAPATLGVLRLDGHARFSGAPLSAVYAGNGRNLAFLQGLFLDDARATPLSDGLPPWRIGAALRRHGKDASLVLAELPPAWSVFLPRANTLVVPAWIAARLELPVPGAPAGRLLPRAAEREAERQQRHHGYALRFAEAPADARRFYHEFYRPYVAARFGGQAVVVAEDPFLERCRGGRIAQLIADGEWVAGMLVHREGDAWRFGWFAARGGKPAQGASEALDLLVIREAARAGTRRIELGHTRPCTADGVLRYKQRLGARFLPTRFPQPQLAIGVGQAPAGVLECFARAPLLAPLGGGLGVYRVTSGGGRISLDPWPG
jgi:hypothetical protein